MHFDKEENAEVNWIFNERRWKQNDNFTYCFNEMDTKKLYILLLNVFHEEENNKLIEFLIKEDEYTKEQLYILLQ